ncbi:hypothetical protein ABL78_5921 [Leptomonas seymouri]|uniref:Uncharacterized protein n=1 Tax=Leptomonas seymouri TaxID=5684 RepID=A0A0N0P4N7_LEPSE|nr:hypothetical protein ABL78_5921 [Leptomonas seymouri]|eukprot:KPI85037.1 hypothetical protein ABL78_5921 [Leptomonas seymouri]
MSEHNALATPQNSAESLSSRACVHTFAPVDGAHFGRRAVFSKPTETNFPNLSRNTLDVGAPPSPIGVATSVQRPSWIEYQRACANEKVLMENVETLKALVLQLAAQLNQAQEGLQLIEQSSSTPSSSQKKNPNSATLSSSPTGGTNANCAKEADLAKEVETVRRDLLCVIAHKDRIINGLQQRLIEREEHFYKLFEVMTKEKDATIERLATDLDHARRSTS